MVAEFHFEMNHSNRVVNLTFHGIGEPAHRLDPGESSVWVSEERFCWHLDQIKERDSIAVTFDDGNHSDIEFGLPKLLERGMKATFFIVAGRLDQEGYLSRADVRTLLSEGMAIGNHGMLHRPWRSLDDAGFESELTDARLMIEDVIESTVTEAACPFGSYGRRLLGKLRKKGYVRVFTSDGGIADSRDWIQPRSSIQNSDGEEFWNGIDQVMYGGQGMKQRIKQLVKRWR